MKWRTETELPQKKGFISYEDSILTIGSCFADEMGNSLNNGGFDISVNPFGVIFNPVSILQLIQNAMEGGIREDLILERDMKFFHYGYHSRVCESTKDDLIKKIEALQYNAQQRLIKGKKLILTFGSAWVYRLENKSVVANCHKMPAQLFIKELLDLDKLNRLSTEFFSKLFELNTELEVVVSVSPVRHTRDGLHENNLSKSVLHLFCQHLTTSFKQVQYFPAYELVVDDLRDYRFYKEDLVHPNSQAVAYVFEKFQEVYFNAFTQQKFDLHMKIKKAQLHHFLNATIDEVKQHEAYIEKLQNQLASLEQ